MKAQELTNSLWALAQLKAAVPAPAEAPGMGSLASSVALCAPKMIPQASGLLLKEVKLRDYPPIMENQMEKKMENEMEAGEYRDLRNLN